MPRLRVALFDMDGTVFDSKIDLVAVRRDLGLPRDGRGILEQISELPPGEHKRGMATLVAAEARGAEEGSLIPGAVEILAALAAREVRTVLVTNNSRASVHAMLARWPLPFDLTLCRDDGPTKPDPALFRSALARFGASPREAVALGDAHLDLLAAHAAGIAEIVLVNAPEWVLGFIPADVAHHRASDLFEAREILESLLDAEPRSL